MAKIEIAKWLARDKGIPTLLDNVEIEVETPKALKIKGTWATEPSSHCFRCGREITHPVSLKIGYGPECSKKIGISWDATEAEKEEVINSLKEIISKKTFEGWLPKSQIEVIDGELKNPPPPKLETKFFIKNGYLVCKSPFEEYNNVKKLAQKYWARWNKKDKQWEFIGDMTKEWNKIHEDIKNMKWKSEVIIDEGIIKYIDEEKTKTKELVKEKDNTEFRIKNKEIDKILYPYQRGGVSFLYKAKKALLGDDMGLGKTLQTIALTDQIEAKKILVVCPNSIKGVWETEIKKWLGDKTTVQIVNGTVEERMEQFKSKAKYIVMNYESLFIRKNSNKNLEENKKLMDKYEKSILDIKPDVIVFDEAHKVKNRKAQVTKVARKLVKKVDRVYLLTGTPMMNRPDELWSLLNMLHPSKYKRYWDFVNKYCLVEYSEYGTKILNGSKNEAELVKEIAPVMLRRLKTEVLSDLPDKTRQTIFLNLSDKQQKIYDEMEELEMIELQNKDVITASIVIAKITRLKQIAVSPNLIDNTLPEDSVKFDALVDIIEGTDEKVVVFSQFAKAIKLYRKKLEALGYICAGFTGEDNSDIRNQEVSKFQDGNARIFLTTIQAGGQGITLTAGSIAVFLDKHWTPAMNEQAEDRLYRIGQKNNVSVYSLIAKRTIEERIEDILKVKKLSFDKIIEGKSIKDISKLFGK